MLQDRGVRGAGRRVQGSRVSFLTIAFSFSFSFHQNSSPVHAVRSTMVLVLMHMHAHPRIDDRSWIVLSPLCFANYLNAGGIHKCQVTVLSKGCCCDPVTTLSAGESNVHVDCVCVFVRVPSVLHDMITKACVCTM
jgi:hypothetical protein